MENIIQFSLLIEKLTDIEFNELIRAIPRKQLTKIFFECYLHKLENIQSLSTNEHKYATKDIQSLNKNISHLISQRHPKTNENNEENVDINNEEKDMEKNEKEIKIKIEIEKQKENNKENMHKNNFDVSSKINNKKKKLE
jgi:hypothetical protein